MPSNIRKPTTIKAGAVAKAGIAVNSGEKKAASPNSTPVVTAVSPVRPPWATPAEDSTKAEVVDVPIIAPQVVAMASVRRAGRMTGSFPSLSRKPALEHTPIRVPMVSNISTNRKENMITTKLRIVVPLTPTVKH